MDKLVEIVNNLQVIIKLLFFSFIVLFLLFMLSNFIVNVFIHPFFDKKEAKKPQVKVLSAEESEKVIKLLEEIEENEDDK